jgi:hypothetical protein
VRNPIEEVSKETNTMKKGLLKIVGNEQLSELVWVEVKRASLLDVLNLEVLLPQKLL